MQLEADRAQLPVVANALNAICLLSQANANGLAVLASRTPEETLRTLIVSVALLFVIGLGSYFLNTDEAFGRLGKLWSDGKTDNSVASRTLARAATWDMAQDKLVTGWGAGSFRHAPTAAT